MAKKIYAIKYGFDFKDNREIRNIMVNTWAECLALVKGVKGAQYKSFESLNEAKEYLSEEKKLLKKGIDSYPMDCIHVYVDGSYNLQSEKFSYGMVAVRNDVIEYMENGEAEDNSQKQLRQIAGELMGAIKAVEYAKSIGERKLVIFHDYEGIYHHAIGTWERKDSSSKEYYDKINSYINKDNMEIIFVKTDSHSGDIYNEITDSYAKAAIRVPLTDAVDKYLSANTVKAKDDIVKEKLLSIIKEKNYDKVICLGENLILREKKSLEEILREIKLLKCDNELLSYIKDLDQNIKNDLIFNFIKEIN
ncbi:ribonuclease H family protein [Clostridium sp. UBA6640]|uniref:ribonuclease H family protein n=1 Tax=Clostridium sp. UBA6640 TaxID=1946370 RepID=UPI0025C30E4F|nr:ribonuclease H family protein [Clostridium sp. UBA6640]